MEWDSLIAWLWSKPKRKQRNASDDVLRLEPGDVVSYDEIDYLVESRYAYSAGGFTWFDYALFDSAADDRIWLSAEDDDGLELAIYRSFKDWVIPSKLDESVSYHREPFTLREHGNAEVSIKGSGGGKRTIVEYWDFESADSSKRLGIERWGGEFETSLGLPIERYEIKIYPRGRDA